MLHLKVRKMLAVYAKQFIWKNPGDNKKMRRIIAISLKLIMWATLIHFTNHYINLLLFNYVFSRKKLIEDLQIKGIFFEVLIDFVSLWVANPISFISFFALHHFFNKKGAFGFSKKSFVIMLAAILVALITEILLYLYK